MKRILFLFAVLGLEVQAATYYVRTDGHDTASGANDTANASTGAWLTVNHATATALAGDTVIVDPGNFPEEVRCADHAGSSGSPITIKAATPGATMIGSFTLEEPWINLSGFYVTNKSVFGAGGVFPQLYIAQNGSHCIVSNMTFNARFDATISPIIKWNGADAQPFGVAGSFNTVISNTILNARSEMVFRIFGDTNLITGNFLGNLDFADCMQIFGRANVFSYNTCSNLFFSGLNNNHADCFQTFGSAGGSSFGAKDNLIDSNIYIGGTSLTNSESLWQVGNLTDDGNPEVKNLTIRNNIFIGIAAKCSVTMPTVFFYNNIFVRCSTNTQNGGAVLIFNTNAVGNAAGGRAYNNIAIDCGIAGATNTGLTYFWPTLVDVKSDYNYVIKNGGAVQIDPSHRAVGDGGGWDTTDWWEPNGINGPKKNVGGSSSTIPADPKFINASQNDYRLLAGSPLIDAGLNLTNFTTDIRGVTRGSTWDIGPYEYSASDFNTYPCDVGPRLIQAYSTVASGATTITWPGNTYRLELKIDRRSYTNKPSAWGVFTNIFSNTTTPGVTNSSSFTDTNIAGVHYEYRIQQLIQTNVLCGDANGYRDYQHLDAGYHVPLKDARGNVILLVESGITNALWAELTRLQSDMQGDGWKVFPHYIAKVEATAGTSWTNAVWATKQLIQTDYNTAATAVWSVFIVGHVPVPYSGDYSPGSHDDNQGAHGTDLFYADLDGTWTDTTVTDNTAGAAFTHNIPGDGKFDQSFLPSTPELRIGRVDLGNMPAFSKTETQLLKQYFDRNHNWRTKQFTVRPRAMVYSDSNTNLTVAGKPLEAHNLFASYFGSTTAVDLGNWLPLSHDTNNTYLFSSKAGSGGIDHDIQMGSADDFAATNLYAVFTTAFGSYYGSWDSLNTNTFLKAILCNGGYPLATWYHENYMQVDSSAMDEPIGQELFATQSGRFYLGTGKEYTHYSRVVPFTGEFAIIDQHKNYESLLGDPTLRTHQVAPVSGLAVNASGADNVATWTASADASEGYHVYRAPTSDLNSFTRLTSVPTTNLTYTDTGASSGTYTYMVRAVKEDGLPNRSFYDASQGVFASASGGATAAAWSRGGKFTRQGSFSTR